MPEKGTALVFTMGFTVDYLVKATAMRGIMGDEEVVFLTVFSTDELSKRKAEDAIKYATDYVTKLGLKFTVKYIDVNVPFEQIVFQVHKELEPYSSLEIYIIGGMRILGLATYYYAILTSPFKKIEVFSFTEDMEVKYKLPVNIPRPPMSSELIRLMAELKEEREIKEVAERLGKTISTISKQLGKLEGLVECREGRPKRCKLNEIGKILLEEVWKGE